MICRRLVGDGELMKSARWLNEILVYENAKMMNLLSRRMKVVLGWILGLL